MGGGGGGAFVLRKNGGSLCTHAVTKGVGGRRAELFVGAALRACGQFVHSFGIGSVVSVGKNKTNRILVVYGGPGGRHSPREEDQLTLTAN